MSSFLDVPGVKPAALDAAATALLNDPASAFRGASNATYGPDAAGMKAAYGRVGAGVARFITRAKAGATLKIVGVGDSITAGTGATLGTNDYMTLVRNALASRFPAATITQSNRAVSGATTATTGINATFASAIADAGDLYIIGFGRNDVAADDTTWGTQPVQGYRRARSLRYFEVMIRAIREKIPQADILIVTENPASTYSSDANMRTYQDGVRELAAAYGAELADTYAAYGTSGYSALLSDGVHPSVAGHQLYADTVMARIPTTLAEGSAGKAAVTLAKGLRTPEAVDISAGSFGWTLMNGSAPGSAYTKTGAGWNAIYPPETSGVGDYAEWTFTGTDFALRVDQTATAAPVVDIKIDGVDVFVNQSLFLSPSSFQLFQFLATGLAPGAHTIRLTLKSGTLRWYQAAWLAGPPTASVFGSPGGLRRMVPSRYYTNPRGGDATITIFAAGDMWAVPIWVPTVTTFNKLSTHVSTAAASSTLTLALYDSDSYDQPRTQLVATAALDSSTTGWKEATISQTLQPGLYWLGILALGGAPRVYGTLQPNAAVTTGAGTLANPLSGYVATGSSALPATWTATAGGIGAPLVALKAV